MRSTHGRKPSHQRGEIGAVRGNTAVVHPTQTTTYTLYSTNQFDRSTQTITITVQ